MSKTNTKCFVCKKPLYRRPSEFKKDKRFCCKGCRSELYQQKYKENPENLRGLKRGHGWNKGLSRKNGDKLSYGRPRSEETKKRISIALKKVKPINPDNHIITNCIICNKEIKTFKSNFQRGNAKFCSKKCVAIYNNNKREYKFGEDNPNWKGGKRKLKCEICKKEFFTINKYARFCSKKCKSKGHSIFMVETPPVINTETDIEVEIEEWLINKKICFVKQKPLEKITIVDFFIEPNICVYADGDYWHSLELTKKRDERINKELLNKGYKVIRLSGSEIKKGVRPIL